MLALTLSADAELQTRWGPVIGLGAGGPLGFSVNAYAGDTVPLGTHWSLRPGFRFVRSWQSAADCPTPCRFDFYIGEIGFRYRGPTGLLYQLGIPLFGWVPVLERGESQTHLKFYTLATSELAFFTTVVVGFTFDL